MVKLVIAEKPSVAQAIARVLGADKRMKGYLTGNGYIVSWCVGHLVELVSADQYDLKYKKWRFEDLPILPINWKYEITESSRAQYMILRKLLNSPEVESIICATDAGREGELIFRLVYEQAQCVKPFQRLWISSLEDQAILDGFADLRDGHDYDDLYKAARCRSHADWLIGINASRLYSLIYNQNLNVGRVQTPTLALIVSREDAIKAFEVKPFYTVQLSMGFTAQSERIFDHDEADALRTACHAKAATVKSIRRKSYKDKPPKLFDLTTLQRDANRLFGFTAQQTLDYAQALYEKQLLTYPRTDSRYLTVDMQDKLVPLAEQLAASLPFMEGMQLNLTPAQVINDSKVSDHHAIIPTVKVDRTVMDNLTQGERSLLCLVATRLICAISPVYTYDETIVMLDCQGHTFQAKGKTVTQMGWLAHEMSFLGGTGSMKDAPSERQITLPDDLCVDQVFSPTIATLKEGKTTPPSHFTDGTLLASMETAGIEDMPEDAERKGLGTPATRAGMIEKLIKSGLVERKGDRKAKYLLPTQKGIALIRVLPDQLKSPLMTAEWEQRLKLIEHGAAHSDLFMNDIRNMVKELTENAAPVPGSETYFPPRYAQVGTCPGCGGIVTERPKGFFCENRTCRFGLWKDDKYFSAKGRPLTADIVSTLLSDGNVHLTGLKSTRTGKIFDATVIMELDENGSPRFRLQFDNNLN